MNDLPVQPPVAPAPKPVLTEKEKAKRRFAEAAISAVIFHVALAILAGAITIAVIVARPKVTFDAKQPPSIPARKLEHSIRVKQMKEQVRKPQILQRLVSQAPSAVALPELPKMDTPDMKKMRDTPTLNRSANMLGDLGRAGGGLGRGDTGGGGFSDTKFFGENVRTRAIVVLVDVTSSMYNKGVVEDVKREAQVMLEGLGPGTKFNLIGFVDGAEAVASQIMFATQENKATAIDWLGKIKMNTQGNKKGWSGSTPHDAIVMAVEMGADTIFLLTDDVPTISEMVNKERVPVESHADDLVDYVKNIETTTGRSVKIHPIVYKASSAAGERSKEYWRRIARLTGGKMQVIE
jgi:hypothetical protein